MPTAETLDALKKEYEQKKGQLSTLAHDTKALEQAIAILEGKAILIADENDTLKDFEGLGIVEAAKRFLKEVGEPKTTGEIAAELLRRGVTTQSKRFVPTVYATLDNSHEFTRLGKGRTGKWTPKEAKR